MVDDVVDDDVVDDDDDDVVFEDNIVVDKIQLCLHKVKLKNFQFQILHNKTRKDSLIEE